MSRMLFENLSLEELKEKAKKLPTSTLRTVLNGLRISPGASKEQVDIFEKELKRRS